MIAPTRRGFLTGAAAAIAVPSVARAATEPQPGPLQAKAEIVRRGRSIAVSSDGRRVVVCHAQRHTIEITRAGGDRALRVDVGGEPLEVAVSPDRRVAAVTTAFWAQPGLAIVDLASGKLRERVDVGPSPFGLAFTPDGRRLVVSGGEQEGTVHVLSAIDFTVIARSEIGTVPRGVAPSRDGRTAWIALNGLDELVRVDLRSGRVTRTARTPRWPERVALSPDGRRMLVAHGGPDADHVSEVDVRTGRITSHAVGGRPAGVAWSRRNRRIVLLGGTGEIVVLADGKRPRRRVATRGGAPRGLAVAGDRAWTVDSLSGVVSRVKV